MQRLFKDKLSAKEGYTNAPHVVWSCCNLNLVQMDQDLKAHVHCYPNAVMCKLAAQTPAEYGRTCGEGSAQ